MTSVLVVDDSQFMRTVLANVLGDHGYDVHTASDGETAIETVAERSPDVITMDVQMPGMGGIEAVERIMDRHPTPILMFSAYTKEGADATLDALSKGAIDFLPKPSGEISADIGELEDELVATIEAVCGADVSSVTRSRAAAAARTAADAEAAVQAASASVRETVGGEAVDAVEPEPGVQESEPSIRVPDALAEPPTVVIGASTGGPRIVERVLTDLPADLDARVLVVQHMPGSFTDRLARRLDDFSAYDVREAADGARVADGEVVIAKGGYHMEVSGSSDDYAKVRLTEAERLHGVRPAIDVTMVSAAREVNRPLVGVALTGMGRDGAQGISTIKSAGGTTIAQDEDSAPVYGIPKQAIATGDVDEVLGTEAIAEGIVEAASRATDTDRLEGDIDG